MWSSLNPSVGTSSVSMLCRRRDSTKSIRSMPKSLNLQAQLQFTRPLLDKIRICWTHHCIVLKSSMRTKLVPVSSFCWTFAAANSRTISRIKNYGGTSINASHSLTCTWPTMHKSYIIFLKFAWNTSYRAELLKFIKKSILAQCYSTIMW